jgi:hypothetical protein
MTHPFPAEGKPDEKAGKGDAAQLRPQTADNEAFVPKTG